MGGPPPLVESEESPVGPVLGGGDWQLVLVEEEQAAGLLLIQQLVLALPTGDLLVQGQAA